MRVLGGAALFANTDAVRPRGAGSTLHVNGAVLALLIVGIGLGQLQLQRRVVAGAVRIAAGVLVAGRHFVSETVPEEFTAMTAFVATLLVPAFACQRLRTPAADGLPYRKGEGH